MGVTENELVELIIRTDDEIHPDTREVLLSSFIAARQQVFALRGRMQALKEKYRDMGANFDTSGRQENEIG